MSTLRSRVEALENATAAGRQKIHVHYDDGSRPCKLCEAGQEPGENDLVIRVIHENRTREAARCEP